MKRFCTALTLSLVALVLAGCVPHTTGETEVGVRTIKLGLFARKGVEDKVYAPGSTYFFMPFVNDWHTFDTKLQNLEMTFETSRGDRKGRDDLLFKTIDGNDIGMDVIIAYRIDPNQAPYILQYVAKNNRILAKKSFGLWLGASLGTFSASSKPRNSTWPKSARRRRSMPGRCSRRSWDRWGLSSSGS